MTDFVNVLIAAVAFMILGVGWGVLKAWLKDRARARELKAIPSVAKALAVEPGSRFATADWTRILTDLHRSGYSLDESLALIRRLKVFWQV